MLIAVFVVLLATFKAQEATKLSEGAAPSSYFSTLFNSTVDLDDLEASRVLSAPDLVSDFQVCLTRCESEPKCTVAMTVKDEKGTECVMINCGNPNTCKFVVGKNPGVDLFLKEPFNSSNPPALFHLPSDEGKDMLNENYVDPNHPEKEAELSWTEICKMPKEIGPCRALIPRYFFNVETNECELFHFGGCRGNLNNFKTEDKCKETCEETVEPTNATSDNSSLEDAAHRSSSVHDPHTTIKGLTDLDRISALVPLIVGLCICVAFVLLVVIRCRVNVKRGPAKFRRMVSENEYEPNGKPFHKRYTAQDIANGAFT